MLFYLERSENRCALNKTLKPRALTDDLYALDAAVQWHIRINRGVELFLQVSRTVLLHYIINLRRSVGSVVCHPRRAVYEYLGIRMSRRLGAVALLTGFFLGWLLLPRFIGGRSYEGSFGPLGVTRTSTDDFVIKGKHVTIMSGAIHYFRVVPDYWQDRLLKLKAMGLNTVETLV